MVTHKTLMALAVATTLISGMALSDGRADRRNEMIQHQGGIEHTHSLEERRMQRMGEGDSQAERNRDRMDSADAMLDHIHRMHGATAAGPQDQQQTQHGHRQHVHTYGGVDYPAGMGAYHRKRWQFDSNRP